MFRHHRASDMVRSRRYGGVRRACCAADAKKEGAWRRSHSVGGGRMQFTRAFGAGRGERKSQRKASCARHLRRRDSWMKKVARAEYRGPREPSKKATRPLAPPAPLSASSLAQRALYGRLQAVRVRSSSIISPLVYNTVPLQRSSICSRQAVAARIARSPGKTGCAVLLPDRAAVFGISYSLSSMAPPRYLNTHQACSLCSCNEGLPMERQKQGKQSVRQRTTGRRRRRRK